MKKNQSVRGVLGLMVMVLSLAVVHLPFEAHAQTAPGSGGQVQNGGGDQKGGGKAGKKGKKGKKKGGKQVISTKVKSGLLVLPSPYSFDETVSKLEEAIKGKGINIFSIIDHKEAGAKVQEDLHPTKVILFGSPKVGTPIMREAPYIALFLPLKVLVVEKEGAVEVVYQRPRVFARMVKKDAKLVESLNGVEKLIAATVKK